MFEGSVLIIKFDEFLFISLEDVDFIVEVTDEDIFLIGFHFDGGVEEGGAFGGGHAV